MRTLIAVPCFDMVKTDFMKCLLDLEKPEGTCYTVIKNTLIYNARNLIADNAVKEGFDFVFWVDSDITFKPDTLVRLLQNAQTYNLDFVSGLYFMRRKKTQPVLYKKIWWDVSQEGNVSTGAEPYTDYPSGLFKADGVGFGCCLTTVKLLKAVGEIYGSPFTPLMGMSEDLAFCLRAKRTGFQLYCNSTIQCGHIGEMIFDEEYFRCQAEKEP